MEQEIRFCTTSSGVRIAYSAIGEGPALVWPPMWITHLQVSLENAAYRSFLESLAQHQTIIMYDRYGCGLSDRTRSDCSLDSDIACLEAVVDHLDVQRFALFGFSDGGPCSIAYAARHPNRVSRIVLYNTYAARVPGEHPRFDASHEALTSLVRASWPIGSRALADVFFPSGPDAETMLWFSRWQQESATGEMAARLLGYAPDVRPLLSKLTMPTLVLHRRGALAIPFGAGRELASLLPDARLLALEGDIHFPGYGDAESILRPVIEFLAMEQGADEAIHEPPEPNPAPDAGLTAREVDVLRLMSLGKTNLEISEDLVISINTVERHVSNVLAKTDTRNRTGAAAHAARHGLLS